MFRQAKSRPLLLGIHLHEVDLVELTLRFPSRMSPSLQVTRLSRSLRRQTREFLRWRGFPG